MCRKRTRERERQEERMWMNILNGYINDGRCPISKAKDLIRNIHCRKKGDKQKLLERVMNKREKKKKGKKTWWERMRCSCERRRNQGLLYSFALFIWKKGAKVSLGWGSGGWVGGWVGVWYLLRHISSAQSQRSEGRANKFGRWTKGGRKNLDNFFKQNFGFHDGSSDFVEFFSRLRLHDWEIVCVRERYWQVRSLTPPAPWFTETKSWMQRSQHHPFEVKEFFPRFSLTIKVCYVSVYNYCWCRPWPFRNLHGGTWRSLCRVSPV